MSKVVIAHMEQTIKRLYGWRASSKEVRDLAAGKVDIERFDVFAAKCMERLDRQDKRIDQQDLRIERLGEALAEDVA